LQAEEIIKRAKIKLQDLNLPYQCIF